MLISVTLKSPPSQGWPRLKWPDLTVHLIHKESIYIRDYSRQWLLQIRPTHKKADYEFLKDHNKSPVVFLLLCSVLCHSMSAVTPCQASDLGAQHGDLGFLSKPHQDTQECHREASWTVWVGRMGKTGERPGEFIVVERQIRKELLPSFFQMRGQPLERRQKSSKCLEQLLCWNGIKWQRVGSGGHDESIKWLLSSMVTLVRLEVTYLKDYQPIG